MTDGSQQTICYDSTFRLSSSCRPLDFSTPIENYILTVLPQTLFITLFFFGRCASLLRKPSMDRTLDTEGIGRWLRGDWLGIVRFILASNLLVANVIKLAASLHLNAVLSASLGRVGFVIAQVFDLITAVSSFSVYICSRH
jgi:hypothetical protein